MQGASCGQVQPSYTTRMTGLFLQELTSPQPSQGDFLGWSVAVGAEYIVTGAPLVDGATTDRGAAYLFDARLNSPPVADAGGPYRGAEGGSVLLDASGSFDLEEPQNTLLFEWDLDYDGVTFDVDQVGVMVSVEFPESLPLREIAVRVTDSQGAASIAVSTLEIQNLAPQVVVDQAIVYSR